MINLFTYLCERSGRLEVKVLCSPELLQGTAGTTGHRWTLTLTISVTQRLWHLSHQDYLKILVPHG